MAKIAYLDCHSGISGDMTLAALIDAGVDLAAVQQGIASLGMPDVRLVVEPVKRHGFRALWLKVEHPPEHKHRHLHHITDMIAKGTMSERARDWAVRIFTRLGEAEAKVHGTTIEKVHFHEVGAVDSIADVVGAAVGWDLLGVDRIVASPIPTGGGEIEIAHGRVTVPAPATAELLCGVPLAASDVQAELTTPTGAAIVATLAESFGPLPAMIVDRIGYGAGSRDLAEQPNVLRLMVGHTQEQPDEDQVWILETNLDDASGQLIGHCAARLMEAGALDVYTTGVQMKKNRPGVILTALCHADHVSLLEQIIFSETTTLGIRRWPASRRKLERCPHQVQTPFGMVEGKLGWLPGEAPRFAPEYESCCRLADEQGVPLQAVFDAARRAFATDSPKQ